jgi:hypothetical protein
VQPLKTSQHNTRISVLSFDASACMRLQVIGSTDTPRRPGRSKSRKRWVPGVVSDPVSAIETRFQSPWRNFEDLSIVNERIGDFSLIEIPGAPNCLQECRAFEPIRRPINNSRTLECARRPQRRAAIEFLVLT